MARIIRARTETPSLSSGFSAIIQRRRRAVSDPPPPPVVPRVTRTAREAPRRQIADFPEDATPVSDLLTQVRAIARPARGTEYLHVSDLISRCIRKFALIEQQDIPQPPQRLSLTDLLTFAQGDAIHDVIKARAVASGPSTVWGKWSCKCGSMRHEDPCVHADLPVQTCSNCDGGFTEYHEVPIRNEELKIVGNPDLVFFLQDFQAFYINELKSIAHEQWKELVRPKPDHVIQVVFYYWLMKHAGFTMVPRVSILYVTKGWMFNGDPFKEFTLDAEEELPRLESYLDEARALAEFRATGKLPARTMCVSDNAPEAKKCEVCSICFRGNGNAPKTISLRQALRR